MKSTSQNVKNARDCLAAQTIIEYVRMLAAGMRCITPDQLKTELAALGYHIALADCFDYINTYNAVSYYARSIYIADKAGLSFANAKANRDNLPALRAIRHGTFCYESGRIWEF